MKLSISVAFRKQDNPPFSPPIKGTFHHSTLTYALHFETLYKGQAVTIDSLLDTYKDFLPTAYVKKTRNLSSLIIAQMGERGLSEGKV